MFGDRRNPPKPSRFEPLILLVLAVVIAAVLTGGYYLILLLAQRGAEPM